MIAQNHPQPYVIRRMRLEDISEVVKIDQASFSLPWPESAYEYELKRNQNSLVYVAEMEVNPSQWRIIGVIVVWLIVDEAHIATLAVHPEYRNQGVAQKLLLYSLIQSTKRGAQKATLEVRENNLVAQHLYQRFGFQTVGRRKQYYRDNNEDALIMTIAPLNLAHLQSLWETIENQNERENEDKQPHKKDSYVRKSLWKPNRN